MAKAFKIQYSNGILAVEANSTTMCGRLCVIVYLALMCVTCYKFLECHFKNFDESF